MADIPLEELKRLGEKTRQLREQLKAKVEKGVPISELFALLPPLEERAFPLNVSMHEVAAHDTLSVEDERAFHGIVKVDVGLRQGELLTDTAVSVDVEGEYGKLVDAAEEALEEAIATIRPGIDTGEVGKVVEEVARKHGLRPINNLTGHKIEGLHLHAGAQIPNVGVKTGYRFREGDVFAVEPFLTTGKGYVVDEKRVEIFAFLQRRPVRQALAKRMLAWAEEQRGPLPFSEWELRQAFKGESLLSFRMALKELVRAKAFSTYPVLREASRAPVAQAEHTVYVDRDGAVVIV